MDWQPFKTAPTDGCQIRVAVKVGEKPMDEYAEPFFWDAQRRCWMQSVRGTWTRQLFQPTHWQAA